LSTGRRKGKNKNKNGRITVFSHGQRNAALRTFVLRLRSRLSCVYMYIHTYRYTWETCVCGAVWRDRSSKNQFVMNVNKRSRVFSVCTNTDFVKSPCIKHSSYILWTPINISIRSSRVCGAYDGTARIIVVCTRTADANVSYDR